MSNLDAENGLIQWGTETSTQDSKQPFSFGQKFADTPVVVNTRTSENSERPLPIVSADKDMFYIDRKDTVDRNERFHWFAAASNTAGGTKVATVKDGDNVVAKIQWGTATSSKDGEQSFDYNQSFSKNCAFVIINRNKADAEDILPVVKRTTTGFVVDRNDGIKNDQSFSWIAIGDVDMSNGTFSIPFGHKIMKGGSATSDSNDAESYIFSDFGLEPFTDKCELVLTQRTDKGDECVMPVVKEDKNYFTVNRDGTISNDAHFDWIAIGK
jgi:hypothetical protein